MEQRGVALQVPLEANYGLGVKLIDTGLGDGKDLSDLLECETLIVIERDYELLSFGEPFDSGSQCAFHLADFNLGAGAGVFVVDDVRQMELFAA